MSAPICFIDTETTSLRPDRRAWEIAVIRREDGATDERVWYVTTDDLDLGNADLISLKIGRFYERHPDLTDSYPDGVQLGAESWVMSDIEEWTRGAHLVGAVPSFDADVLGRRMRAHGVLPSWHHHLIDVEAMAVGWLYGKYGNAANGGKPVEAEGDAVDLPWRSDDLAAACGVAPVPEAERHTALGDARWVARWWDAITGGAA